MSLIKTGLKITSLIFALVSFNIYAKVSMSVDRSEISQGETFVLNIQLDRDTSAQPDLSLIPKEFTIVSSSQYNNTQIFNGKRTTLKGWKIKLKTLKKGPITIPAIEVDDEFTQPIQLTIKDTSNQLTLNGQDKVIFLESEIDVTSVYVQQQVIYTVSLYRAVNTHYASLTEPTAENAIVEKLGDDEQFEKIINNRRYVVTKRRYALFPQQSGETVITPVNFTADINENNRRNYNSFINATRPVSISTEQKRITVKPKPAQFKGFWLPASEVVIADKWTPVTSSLTVGEPVTWTILLSVQGLSESQLPEIKIPEVEGLQWYYDTPQKERQLSHKGIQGQRVEKLAVIPSQEGEFTIPEIKISWWDTKSDSAKVAILAARTIKVLAGTAKTQTPTINQPVSIPQTSPTTTLSSDKAVRQWQMIAGLFLLLWLLTLVAFFKKKGAASSTHKTSERPDNSAHKDADAVFKQLKSDLESSNAKNIEQSLLKWLNLSGFSELHSLGALASQLTENSLKNRVQAFEAARYSAAQQNSPVSLTISEIKAIRADLTSQHKAAVLSQIPPLYSR